MRMRLLSVWTGILATTLSYAQSASALDFYPISSISSSTAATDYFQVTGLIEGPGVGFDANEPHNKAPGTATSLWVTDAPGGFPSDFIAVAGAPVLILDLGSNQSLSAIAAWNYSTNANNTSEYSLRFATSAEGPSNFGASIDYNPTFTMEYDPTPMQLETFAEVVTARYVEFTVADNYFVPPGDGSGGEIPGGDRAGLGEIAFPMGLPIQGDVNADGVINLVDYGIIRDNFYTGTTYDQGDLNFDSIVNEEDFRIWKTAFSGSASVPEPATWALGIVGVAAAYALRRRRSA